MKKNAMNAANMKRDNRQLLLHHVRQAPVSRADLARVTGLTRAAVSLQVEALLRDGILQETGMGESEYGRKPVLLDLNPAGRHAAGLSLTRDGCRVGLLDFKGKVLASRTVDLPTRGDVDRAVDRMAEAVSRLVGESGLPPERMLGLGVCVPGPVDVAGGVMLNPPNFGRWHGVRLADGLRSRLPLAVHMENNAAALALAEKNHGRGRTFDSFMLLVVDTGVGAGLVMNGRLYGGVGGFGSEIGHASINWEGPLCGCGNTGCLECYASMPALLARNAMAGATWKALADGAEAGDAACIAAIAEEAFYLAKGIVNAMNLLELEAVILAGDITYKPGALLARLQQDVDARRLTRSLRPLPILCAQPAEDAEIAAAGSIVIDKYLAGELTHAAT